MHASKLVEKARQDLKRAKEAGERIEVRTQFIDGASGGVRPCTSGGSSVLYHSAADGTATVVSGMTPMGGSGSGPRIVVARHHHYEPDELKRRHPHALHPMLTTRVAAHGGDYYDAYCGACEFGAGKRVIQRRFNVGVLEAISERKASTL